MRNVFMESAVVSLNKRGEDLCGDFVTTVNTDDATTIVLSDGLGSGVKANILATLTSKILATMIANNISIEDSIYTYAKTLPICSVRKMAYSTFTVLRAGKNAEAYLAQYDNPDAILLREGIHYDYPFSRKIIEDKEISESRLILRKGDILILITDGVTHAGLGKVMPNGWDRADIIRFLESIYSPDLSPKQIAMRLGAACRDLYQNSVDDDTTVAVFKIRERQVANLIIGPPQNKEDDEKILRLFFSKEGSHIVCGGSTANMVSRYLGKTITVRTDDDNPELPPAGMMEGVELVTEGVLTIGKVVKMAKDYLSCEYLPLKWKESVDAASLIAKILFEQATDINFFVGKAINPSHQNPDLNIDFTIKMGLIGQLQKSLEKMGKKVKVSYC